MSSARTAGNARPAATTTWRWAVLALLSLLLHLLALGWVNGKLHLPGTTGDDAPAVLQTTLVSLPVPSAPQPAPLPKPRTATRAAAKPAKPRLPTPIPAPIPAAAPAQAPAAAETPPILSAAASDTAMASIAAEAATPTGKASDAGFGWPELAALEPAAAPGTSAPEQVRYTTAPPPSATLDYNVQALREGQTVYGHGKIAWQHNGSQYTIQGKAGILFFSLLDFASQGRIDESGVTPAQYTEKRFRRAQTETRFDRERRLISFSASAKSFPLQGGEQDRASLIWQLAGIGRGDGGRFAPGAQFPLFIAGVRDGSTWIMQVVGEEEVSVGLGALRAWHVRRAPRAGDKDQILDIWLAPSHHWYPVKLRYTEANGEYLELSLSGIDAPAS